MADQGAVPLIRSSLTVFVLTILFLSGACTTDNDFLRPGDPTILDELEPVDTLRARNDPFLYGTITFIGRSVGTSVGSTVTGVRSISSVGRIGRLLRRILPQITAD